MDILKNNTTVRSVLRYITIAVIILFTAPIQNSVLIPLTRYETGCYMLLSATVSAAMFEKEFAGMFFGLLAGALWDISSPVPDGVYALFFTAAACACGLLTHYVFRNSLRSAAVLTAGVFVLFAAVSLIFRCLAHDITGVGYYITVYCFRSFLATLLLLPLSYYPIRLAEKLLR